MGRESKVGVMICSAHELMLDIVLNIESDLDLHYTPRQARHIACRMAVLHQHLSNTTTYPCFTTTCTSQCTPPTWCVRVCVRACMRVCKHAVRLHAQPVLATLEPNRLAARIVRDFLDYPVRVRVRMRA